MPSTPKYCVDTNVIISLFKSNGEYSKDVHRSLWDNFQKNINSGKIISGMDAYNEMKDDDDEDLKQWLKDNKSIFLEVDEDQVEAISTIVKKYPLISEGFANIADPVLVGLCISQSLTMITQEKFQATPSEFAPKIPNLCDEFDVPCVNINGFCRQEGIIL